MMRVDGASCFRSLRNQRQCRPPSNRLAAVEAAGDQKLVDALKQLMAAERIYRHDNITIGTLASS